MSNIVIENENLRATINPLGAELVSLLKLDDHTEYMWDANPAFWGKTSPVLFPIVGGLKNDTYFYQGKEYKLPRHGFARTMNFEVESQTQNSVVFLLKNNPETEKVYPFAFELRLAYTLIANKLELKYQITNPDSKALLFSIGGHPAFKCPIENALNYEDYFLEFHENEDLKRWPLNSADLVLNEPLEISKNTNKLLLTKELFHQDALVFKHLKSDCVTLKSKKNLKQLKFEFKNFPYLGIWAAKDADFVCIEPWCGIADSADTNQNLKTKEGIISLESKGVFERGFSLEIS
ncbi:aldose 1-epimerase family protein [Lacihabitans soyangensis]|uniref:Aldose 1-epimerase family protein n=1 Tax=Lacihabitans soyangensis TaxID=869394 RepID=A0AAE3H5H4_9BACT|nr:aldose 1-epimerase family protein [Lacihabitans soyangensis]MCP9764369.1 aldose 1-epimerase family protein [Lacihabitans soyangensis]